MWLQIQDADVLNSSACRLDMIDGVTSKMTVVCRFLVSALLSEPTTRDEYNKISRQNLERDSPALSHGYSWKIGWRLLPADRDLDGLVY